MDEKNSHFGEWLERTIQDTGVSVHAFAKSAGIPYRTVWRWCASAHPSIYGHSIARLAKSLGLSREQIETRLSEARAADSAAA